MNIDALYQQIKKTQEKLKWAGLSSNPEYVQLCHEAVERNAERIEKVLGIVSELRETCDFVEKHKGVLFNIVSEKSWEEANEFQQTMQEVMCHFCECIDAQSNFLLNNKNVLISQNDAEKALIYRHIQVDLVRTFQRLHYIDEYIRENDNMFEVEEKRRECNKLKSDINKKYGIDKGTLHKARNKTAAHWDNDVDYIDLYERSKEVNYDWIRGICIDMLNLTQAYSQCLQDALKNYIESVGKVGK